MSTKIISLERNVGSIDSPDTQIRCNPWGREKSWTQNGILAMVFFTHQPDAAVKIYLCKGEWDALLLGWLLKDDPTTLALAT